MDLKQNYFQLFGLTDVFDLDVAALTERYLALQKHLHPDRFASASDQERRLSLQQAAQVNSGYETLRDPLARARYLLSLHNGDVNDETSTINDPEFLEEQMALRESLAEIRFATDVQATLLSFMDQLETKSKHYVEALKLAFSCDTIDVAHIKGLVQRMQFTRKLQQEAEALEEELLV